jgi:hypothetical protein
LRVFVSFAEEDAAAIPLISTALSAWQLTYWAPLREPTNPEQDAAIQRGLTQADIFLRICTGNTPRSYWMTMEQTAFLVAQAEEYRQSGQLHRRLINLVIDEQYRRQPFDYADPTIDATNFNDSIWQEQLYTALFTSTVS